MEDQKQDLQFKEMFGQLQHTANWIRIELTENNKQT